MTRKTKKSDLEFIKALARASTDPNAVEDLSDVAEPEKEEPTTYTFLVYIKDREQPHRVKAIGYSNEVGIVEFWNQGTCPVATFFSNVQTILRLDESEPFSEMPDVPSPEESTSGQSEVGETVSLKPNTIYQDKEYFYYMTDSANRFIRILDDNCTWTLMTAIVTDMPSFPIVEIQLSQDDVAELVRNGELPNGYDG